MSAPLISAIALKRICWKTGAPNAGEIAEVINLICPFYGINKLILHEFLANVLHESEEFTNCEENLNYTAKRLTEVWPMRFKTLEEASAFAHNPLKLAIKVYNGRMGNTDPLDGWTFRGSGPIQMTGRTNFILFASWMDSVFGITLTEHEWADYVRVDIETGLHAACWIFSISKGLNEAALSDEMIRIIKKINGGTHGLADRLKYYELCKKYLS